MFALAAVLVGLGFLEEGEGLGHSGSSEGTRAAFNFGDAVGVLADQLALGFGAVGLVALPVAFGFLADGFTFRLGSLAVSDAVGLLADGDALGAVEHLAAFVGAFNFTLGLFAFYIADSVLGFGAGSVALGRLADWVANGGAVRVVAFPGTLRMALG